MWKIVNRERKKTKLIDENISMEYKNISMEYKYGGMGEPLLQASEGKQRGYN